MSSSAGMQKRLGPILLSPGVTPIQILVFTSVVLAASFTNAFANLMQPLLVTEQLHVATGQQGVVMGALSTTQQMAVLLVIGLSGVLADRFGRRRVLMGALAGFAVCMWIYPLVSVLAALFLMRFAWGASFTGLTAGAATKMMDYPANSSRGKFLSLMIVTQAGGGAVFMTLFSSRIVSWLKGLGLTSAEAIRYGFWLMSLVAVVGLVVAFVFLAKDDPKPDEIGSRSESGRPGLGETIAGFGRVLGHARVNPRFAVVLLIGAVIRTDSVVLGAFLGLWIIQAGIAQGVAPIEATKTIGIILAIGQISQFVTPPLFGWLADRMDRLTLLIVAMGMTAIAFGSFGLVSNVFSVWMMVVAVMVGLAEGAQSISANALLGEECPPDIRGAAIGAFTFLGTGSVLIISLLAGYLFDKVGHSAPFVMEGLLNLAVCIAAIALVQKNRRSDRASREASAP